MLFSFAHVCYLSQTDRSVFIKLYAKFEEVTIKMCYDELINLWKRIFYGRKRINTAQSGKTKSCGCLQGTVIRESLQLIDGTSVKLLESRRNTLLSSNTSGCTGVYQNRKGKWAAQITFKGKTYYLGSYAEKGEAIRARKRGEEMHDEFLRWYYLEYMGLEQLPEEIQRMIENESNEDDAGSELATADVD